MLVLHAGVCEQQLYVWGEIPALEQGRSARRGKSATPHRVLPYNAGVDQLSTALASAGITLPVKPGAESLCLWLPTVQDTPLASSALIAEPPTAEPPTAEPPTAEPPASVAKATLAPWTVTAVPLSMPHAIEVFCASMGKQILTPGVVVGSDLAFWATVLRFAGTLTAQHQFLPTLVWEPGKYRARWQPVFVGAMSEGMALLIKAMPHACRALTREALTPPQDPAASVLTSTIGAMVDQLVRSSTNGTAVTLNAPTAGRRQRTPHAPSFSSVHDQWLYRLRTGDDTMDGEAETLSQFVEQIGEWQRPIAIEAATPFRLCLRLEEPPAPGEESLERGTATGGHATGGHATSGRAKREDWYVRYLLQATDDPSLLLETQQVGGGTNGHAKNDRVTRGSTTGGRAKNGTAALHQHNDFNVREYLLGALGQVTGICPEVEASLKTATPQGYALDTTGAYQFLTDKAQALELCGVRVLLPAWWTRKGTKLRLAAHAQVQSPRLRGNSGLSLDAIAEFQWQVALGDEVLTLEELQALATLKQPLVRVRGQWVQMSAAEIETALAFWKNQAATRASVRDVVRMALGAGQPPGGMEFDGVTAEGWIAELLDQLDGRVPFTELPPPPGFHGTLRPYQARGYSWLEFLHRWGLGACLADDMGLGKTIQTLSLLQREWESGGRQLVQGSGPLYPRLAGTRASWPYPHQKRRVHDRRPAARAGALELRLVAPRLRDIQRGAVGWGDSG
jgi:SNF2 Helicase protein